jgi:hypothetical protein
MAAAIKTKDLPKHQAKLEIIVARKRAKNQSEAIRDAWSTKRFVDLNGQEKEELLKAIALELGMIAPD